jgi:hypothetical protein
MLIWQHLLPSALLPTDEELKELVDKPSNLEARSVANPRNRRQSPFGGKSTQQTSDSQIWVTWLVLKDQPSPSVTTYLFSSVYKLQLYSVYAIYLATFTSLGFARLHDRQQQTNPPQVHSQHNLGSPQDSDRPALL